MSRKPLRPVAPAPMASLQAALPADPVPLGGTPLIDLPQHLLDAVAAQRYTGYSPPAGLPALREAIAERHDMPTARVIVTAGAMQALDLAFRLLVGDGEVVTPRPGFFIDEMVASSGGTVTAVPHDDRNRPLWGEAAVTPGARAVYANTPVNPTGYVYDESDIQALHRLVIEHDLWLIADEAHVNFVYRGEHLGLLTDAVADRTVLVRSFSKDYGLAGWRVGYAVVPEALAAPMTAMLERQTVATNTLGQSAALAALTGPRGWIDAMAATARSDGERFAAAIGIDPPSGGLALFPAVPDSLGAARRLIELGIPALPGEAFGTPGFLRLQFSGVPGAVDRAIARISAVDWISAVDGIQP